MSIMDLLKPEILQLLGVSAVLAVFLYLSWQRLDKREKAHREDRKEQNTQTNSMLTESIKVGEGVKNALDNNTQVMNKVLDRFDHTMRDSQKE